METLDFIENGKKKKQEETKLLFDLIFQSIIIGICLLSVVFGEVQSWLFLFYFVMGGYQLLSSFLHLAYKNHSKGRIFYWPQLVIHGLSFLLLLYVRDPLGLAVIILFTTGFTALYYYFLTLIEYVNIKK